MNARELARLAPPRKRKGARRRPPPRPPLQTPRVLLASQPPTPPTPPSPALLLLQALVCAVRTQRLRGVRRMPSAGE